MSILLENTCLLIPLMGSKFSAVGGYHKQFSVIYGYHELAVHTVLASFQFDPGGLLSRGVVVDPGGFTRFLKPFPVACLVLLNWMNGEQSAMYYLCNAPNMCRDGCGCVGQLPFRQRGVTTFTQV